MKKSIILTSTLLGLGCAVFSGCTSTKNVSENIEKEATVTKLELGEITTYDFGKIKLHAYKTNDPLADECYVLENEKNVVILESSAFKAQVQELSAYVAGLNKTLAGTIMAYHPNGNSEYKAGNPFATATALKSWSPNGGIYALTSNFVQGFGGIVADKLPNEIKEVKEGENRTIGGIKFNFIEAGDDAFSVEIPEINVIYRHMMGSTCHNILTSPAHIDAEIATLKNYQAKNYALILTSHFVPEGQAAVAQKIAYLENVKSLATSSTTKEAFINAVKSAYPTYSGENYLEMTAGFLFK